MGKILWSLHCNRVYGVWSMASCGCRGGGLVMMHAVHGYEASNGQVAGDVLAQYAR
jgi:hypothetical protein